MNTLILMISILMFFSGMFNKNPIKMSMTLMATSGAIFMLMYTKSGEVWFPLIFFLLFMGGILIMFMILSAMMPNEKMDKLMKKNTKPLIVLFMTVNLLNLMMKNGTNMSKTIETKAMLSSEVMFFSLSILMVLYFYTFSKLMITTKNPLRSIMCWKMNNFVNY